MALDIYKVQKLKVTCKRALLRKEFRRSYAVVPRKEFNVERAEKALMKMGYGNTLKGLDKALAE